MTLPCGRCIGCRLERARQWAVRIMHESQMHDSNCFITLTYAPEHLPKDGSLSVSACQSFLKRLRSRVSPVKIRFFLCGEYGENFERPHYHAIIFGYDFPDKVKMISAGSPIFTSETLDDCWGMGYTSIGSVTFDSASYVANYATKKVTADKPYIDRLGRRQPSAKEHYQGRHPEFILMSRRPGIGRHWIEKFQADVYPSDEIIVNEHISKPPRYYDNFYRLDHELEFARLSEIRQAAANVEYEQKLRCGTIKVAKGRDSRKLDVRRKICESKIKLKSRNLEKLK